MLLLLVGLSVAACGWQLRGAGGASLEGAGVRIVDNAGSSSLRRAAERGVEGAGGRVVESAGADDLILTLYGEGDSRSTLSVDAQGRVTEYELTYTLEYSVTDARGETRVSRQSLQTSRAYPHNEDQPEVSRQRRDDLREELRGDAVRLLMLRLQTL